MATNNLDFTGANQENPNETTLLSPALQGKELTSDEFKDWIEQAEGKPTISLQEATNKWTTKRKHLQSNTK